MNTVSGNITGLKPSQKHALERVYRRRLRPEEIASAELAGYLCEVSREIERQVGILANRRGDIEHVFVGDASRITLPELGRIRAGRGRFRGLRLVHTHLRNEPLTRDDLVDLALDLARHLAQVSRKLGRRDLLRPQPPPVDTLERMFLARLEPGDVAADRVQLGL